MLRLAEGIDPAGEQSTRYIPHQPTPKQQLFLRATELEVLYGGAAGGGKSDALLMAALQYVGEAGYAALLLRRTYKELSLPEALMDRAHEWLAGTDAVWHADAYTWKFPSGATLTFGYLDRDAAVHQYQGAAFQFCGFDELTQFTEYQYRYLLSRLRRLRGSTVPLRMRAATNPGGVGHEWVKQRFITSQESGRLFIPARLVDNPYLDQEEYAQALGLLDDIRRAQLLDGNWNITGEGILAQRQWFPIVPAGPAAGVRVRAWDFAATEKKVASQDPDYTVGTLIVKAESIYYVTDVIRVRVGPGAVEDLVEQTARLDGPTVAIKLEQEPGSSGKLASAAMVRKLAGWNVEAVPATGDKVARAMPLLAQAQAGNVRIVEGAWNGPWLDEVAMFPVGAHDDQVDSAALAFQALTISDVRPLPPASVAILGGRRRG